MPWSPRNCGLLVFWVWQILAALCIAKHHICVAWYAALTEPNAMLGARYHVALCLMLCSISFWCGKYPVVKMLSK
jgi:hypothetical protein